MEAEAVGGGRQWGQNGVGADGGAELMGGVDSCCGSDPNSGKPGEK